VRDRLGHKLLSRVVERRVAVLIRERARVPAAPRFAAPNQGVSIHEAARQLGVCTQTIRRWLAEGLLPAQQTAPHAPWRIRLSDEVRRRFTPDVPHGYVKLDQAALVLGVARQTVLNQVRAGRRDAIHATQGKRRGLRIQLHPSEQGLLDARPADAATTTPATSATGL
jgi:excisionase family DNA binding protein